MTKRRLSCLFHTMIPFFSLLILLNIHDSHAWCPGKHQNQIKTTQTRLHAAARQQPYKEDDYYDEKEDKDWYWEHEQPTKQQPSPLDFEVDMDALEQDTPQTQGSGVYYYQVSFDGTYHPDELQLDWEEYQDGTMILLPPTYVETPKCILHFVGGTFFGSSPKLWYRTLLEGIVRATQSVVIATPIPVTLWKNPLHHVRISRKLQRQFASAYRNVVQDEYDDLSSVPLVGMGHSLGARLLTVLATLDNNNNKSDEESISPYQAFILMSFTNYGSAASIPGIQSLLNQSKKLEESESEYTTVEKRRRTRDYTRNNNDDDYDEEWEELMEDFQSTWREQASRFQTALTPASKEMEFYPTPDQLWKALKEDSRYHVPNTLVVQFEQDMIDQSPRLTDCLLESTDIKYCRLKGNHLTPISAGSNENDKEGGLLQLSKRASKALWKLVRGKQSPHTADELRDLRQSIARYITDVVAAPTVSSTS